MRDVWLRTGLAPRVLERLADADAFSSLGFKRRDALWAAKALGRVGDRDDDLPLFSTPAAVQPLFTSPSMEPIKGPREPDVSLPPMPIGEEVVNDYRFLRLSLRAHPCEFLRGEVSQRGILRNESLRTTGRKRSNVFGQTMMLAIAVSSSMVMKITPLAEPGRCRQVTRPETVARAPDAVVRRLSLRRMPRWETPPRRNSHGCARSDSRRKR